MSVSLLAYGTKHETVSKKDRTEHSDDDDQTESKKGKEISTTFIMRTFNI